MQANQASVAMVALVLALAGCTDSGSSTPLTSSAALAANPNSTLTAVVTVSTSAPSRVSVTAVADDHRVEIAQTSNVATEHEIPLVGLRADHSYTVTTTATSNSGATHTTRDTWVTGSLPDDLPPVRVDSTSAEMAPGVTMFNIVSRSADRDGPLGYVVAVDDEGEVVWYYASEYTISDVSTTSRGTVLLALNDSLAREIDLLGNTQRELGSRAAVEGTPEEGSFIGPDTITIDVDSIHHELHELDNGNLITLSTELVTLPEAEAERLCPDNPIVSVVADVAVELTPTGDVVHEWPLTDVFTPESRPGSELCVEAGIVGTGNWLYPDVTPVSDWTHANAVQVDPETNTLLVSIRHLDSIVALRYADDEDGPAGELLWEVGPDGSLELVGDGGWTYHQHDPELDDAGGMLVYDNGNGRPGTASAGGETADYTRVVEYELDLTAETVEQTWELRFDTPAGASLFAPFVGGVDRLDNGNVLVAHGAATDADGNFVVRIVEIDPDGSDAGEVVFDVTVGGGAAGSWTGYRAERLPSLAFGHTTGS